MRQNMKVYPINVHIVLTLSSNDFVKAAEADIYRLDTYINKVMIRLNRMSIGIEE